MTLAKDIRPGDFVMLRGDITTHQVLMKAPVGDMISLGFDYHGDDREITRRLVDAEADIHVVAAWPRVPSSWRY